MWIERKTISSSARDINYKNHRKQDLSDLNCICPLNIYISLVIFGFGVGEVFFLLWRIINLLLQDLTVKALRV